MTAEIRTLETPDVDLVYEVRRPTTADAGHPTLLMAGHPMDARGFDTLASYFSDRTVVAYDPRGIGRSGRKDGSDQRTPAMHAADLHALIAALGPAPVDVFASSGGAVNALALVAAHPDDVATLVAHEPPLLAYLPDADHAFAAERAVQTAYHEHGFGAGMAAFIALTSWTGEFTDDYLAQAATRPGAVRPAHAGRRPPRRPAAVRHRPTRSPATVPTWRPCRRRPRASWSGSASSHARC